MPVHDEWEEAAGQPAAGLLFHLNAQAVQLDAHRRELAGDDEELARLLLGIEQAAFRQVYEQVQEGREAWSSPSRSSSSGASWVSGSSRFSSFPALHVHHLGGALCRRLGTQLGKWMRSLTRRASVWKKSPDGGGPASGASGTASAPGGAGEQPAGPIVQGEVVE